MESIFEYLMCCACENADCEYYTIYNGCLLCSYCLEDWLENNPSLNVGKFEEWIVKQRKIMREDRNKSKQNI